MGDRAAGGGALEAAVEARNEGLVRFIGVTGHGLTVPRMHLRSLERFSFDSVLLPYSDVQMRDERYATDFGALASVCAERRVAVQTIKSISRAPWDGRPNGVDLVRAAARAGWTSISLCTGFLGGGPDLPHDTVGDVTLMSKGAWNAASQYESRPADAAMEELIARRELVSLFS